MTRKIKYALALVALAALPAIAAADAPDTVREQRQTARRIVSRYDMNDNGRMNHAEWYAARYDHMTKLMRQVDRDRSGFITRREARLQYGSPLFVYFAEIDSNHNGRITKAELLAAPELKWGRKGTRTLVRRYNPYHRY